MGKFIETASRIGIAQGGGGGNGSLRVTAKGEISLGDNESVLKLILSMDAQH